MTTVSKHRTKIAHVHGTHHPSKRPYPTTTFATSATSENWARPLLPSLLRRTAAVRLQPSSSTQAATAARRDEGLREDAQGIQLPYRSGSYRQGRQPLRSRSVAMVLVAGCIGGLLVRFVWGLGFGWFPCGGDETWECWKPRAKLPWIQSVGCWFGSGGASV